MASKAVLMLGALGAAAVALFAFGKHADAAGRGPKGFTFPPNTVRAHLPAVNGGIAIDGAEYPAEPGQPPGNFTIVWDPADPDNTFVALFTPAATPDNPAVMSVGTSTNSQLLLSTVPNMIARLKASR